MTTKKTGFCSFCGRKASDVRLLIEGVGVNICDNCVEQAHEIVRDNIIVKSNKTKPKLDLKKPAEIKAFFDQYVIG